MRIFSNPIAFTPLPVTILISLVYAAIIISLLVVHHVLPDVDPKSIPGVDLDEAWRDLQTLTSQFHPYNSHRNDEVRTWLLDSIEYYTSSAGAGGHNAVASEQHLMTDPPVLIISDMTSNVSWTQNKTLIKPPFSSYFEGTNVMVYIRGWDDDPSDIWLQTHSSKRQGGVLINAHYDSVSTGYGATDTGIGVVTILQLIKYFSAPDRQPKKGIVALFNNGEEDGLLGAQAFAQHPLSRFTQTFLNLEGAGAGGRATLFRSTDIEVTRPYQQSKYPFGSVLSADAFKRGLIKSGTDYSIFTDVGMRGLDVAFYQARSRYHTNQDDTKHTSRASLFHMLSSAMTTVQGLANEDTGGSATDGVWFDLFGRAFAVFQLNTLFALSITLIVVAPVTLGTIWIALVRTDRSYILSGSVTPKGTDNEEPVSIKGRRGVSRWPFAFVLASAAVIALAFLLAYVNPYIIYSSAYSVWAMEISVWVAIASFYAKTADRIHPTAFQRLYTILWLSLAAWIVLVASTILEKREKIAGTYLMFFYHASVFVGTTICCLELFRLPRKSDYVSDMLDAQGTIPGSSRPSSSRTNVHSGDEQSHEPADENDEDEADERTSLMRGSGPKRTTFKHYTSPNDRAEAEEHEHESHVQQRKIYGLEQPWSHSLPASLWFFEFIIIAAFPLVIFGQTSLFLTSALSQTLADGSSPLLVYLAVSVLSIILFAPSGPFLHRFTHHIPTFLCLVFVGTLIYNMLAFPFSANNRLKVKFIQKIDLETGANNVTLTGVDQGSYLPKIVHSLPSVAGQTPDCGPSPLDGLSDCTYHGLAPQILSSSSLNGSPVKFGITRSPNLTHTAHFRLSAHDSRACRIQFSHPITTFRIAGSGPEDPRFPISNPEGSRELRLWSRTWDREWRGQFSWKGDKEMSGRVVCLWSDANTPGTIPALDEVWKYAPVWAAVTKADDGLVEMGRGWSF